MFGNKAVGALSPHRHEKSFKEYFEDLEKNGKTVIPCPHGHGTYHLKVEGSHWYLSPEIIFDSNENCPMPFRDPHFGGHAFRVHGGRVIPWFPKWKGRMYRPNYELGTQAHNLQFAKMVVRIILSGRRLYLLRCGDSMSSLNDDRYLQTKNEY